MALRFVRPLLIALAAWLALLLGGSRLAPAAGIDGCPLFPPDSIWNTRIDHLPAHPRSADYVASIGAATPLHPDFGSGIWDGGPIGIPFVSVPGSLARVSVAFDYADQSDPGPYPIPADPPIEGGAQADGDRHVLVVDRDACRLYELYAAYPLPDGSWHAGSGAVWDLTSHALRPATWTSADAAGLPILPGLVRYEEVEAGEIQHAIRFTAHRTQRAFVWPARHFASAITDPSVPPMGQRFRLKASFDVSPFPPAVQVILRALQTYGLILADNGSDWYLSGAPDPRWDDESLVESLRQVTGADFEAVDVSGLMVDPDSGQAHDPAGELTFTLSLNQTVFAPGDQLRLDAALAYGGPPRTVDVYLVVRLPGGAGAVFLSGYPVPALVPGALDGDPAAFPPLATGIPLPTGFAVAANDLLVYTFTGIEPPGEYEVIGAVTPAGALADGVIDAGDLLVVATQRITVTAAP